MKKAFHLIFTIFFVGVLISCQKDLPPNPDLLGHNYYPLELGHYVDYQVHKEEYSINDDDKILDYQLREVVTDTFTDLSNRKTYVIERFVRANEDQAWEIDSVWAATNTSQQLIRTENNINYIKLVFPLDYDLTWNGNSLNTLPEWNYQIKDYRKPIEINGLNFEHSLKVIQANDSTLIDKVNFEEYYAEGVGIIKVHKTNLRYESEGDNVGLNIIQSGYIYDQTIIDYGQLNND